MPLIFTLGFATSLMLIIENGEFCRFFAAPRRRLRLFFASADVTLRLLFAMLPPPLREAVAI